MGEELRALGDANGFDKVLRLQSYVDRVTSGGNNVLVAPNIVKGVLRGMFEANRHLTTEVCQCVAALIRAILSFCRHIQFAGGFPSYLGWFCDVALLHSAQESLSLLVEEHNE